MINDIEMMMIDVFCTADDLLFKQTGNVRRMITVAEIVTLCVAQALLGVASDLRFLSLASRLLGHLFPRLP